MKKIAVIGNGGGGKTTLSRRLHELYQMPLTHVDSIQYTAGMQTRNIKETRIALNKIADSEEWIIDGFGPIDVMEKRFLLAEKIVFVDFPLWRHYWWCTKRQLKSQWSPRSELPENCNEATLTHTMDLYKTLWRVHTKIRPKLLNIFSRHDISRRVVTIKNLNTWNSIYKNGFNEKVKTRSIEGELL